MMADRLDCESPPEESDVGWSEVGWTVLGIVVEDNAVDERKAVDEGNGG
jgi:hypothetical protein